MSADNALSMLIHGRSKAGKSNVSFTAPFPLLVQDAEGSTKFINTAGFRSKEKVRKIKWNPLEKEPPRHDGSWDVCVANIPDWMTMKTAYDHLRQSPHDFKSLSMDSVTEIQRKCKKNISSGQFQQQDWGKLLDEMDALIRGYRDMTLLPHNPLQVAVFIAETRQTNNIWSPYMQGAIQTSLPYWVDICGFLFQEADETGAKKVKMLAANHPQYEAGARVQGKLPDIVIEPNITEILNTVYA